MEYKQIEELAKTELSDLFNIWEADEQAKRRLIMAFIQGFINGEAHQIAKHIERTQEATERILNSIES